MQTQMKLLLQKQSDVGLHCLHCTASLLSKIIGTELSIHKNYVEGCVLTNRANPENWPKVYTTDDPNDLGTVTETQLN